MNGSTTTATTTMVQHEAESCVWTDNEADKLQNITLENKVIKTQ